MTRQGIPWWAWVAAGVFLAASVIVFAFGRGGPMVLLGTALGFGALACLLLSEPDGDPERDDEASL
jgi:hypothetical protein